MSGSPVPSAKFKWERIAGLLALWCVATLVLMFVRPNFSSASKPQHGISDPVLALQMAHDIGDVDALLGESPSLDREVMRIKQYEDFGFIAGYAGLYLTLSLLLARTGPRLLSRAGFIALVAAIAGLGAAAFDVIENFAILRILDVKLAATSQSMIDAIHHASLAKWALGFIALGLLSTYFLWDRRRTAKVVGGIDAAAAIVGIISLFDHVFLIPAAGLIGLGLCGASVVLLFMR